MESFWHIRRFVNSYPGRANPKCAFPALAVEEATAEECEAEQAQAKQLRIPGLPQASEISVHFTRVFLKLSN